MFLKLVYKSESERQQKKKNLRTVNIEIAHIEQKKKKSIARHFYMNLVRSPKNVHIAALMLYLVPVMF